MFTIRRSSLWLLYFNKRVCDHLPAPFSLHALYLWIGEWKYCLSMFVKLVYFVFVNAIIWQKYKYRFLHLSDSYILSLLMYFVVSMEWNTVLCWTVKSLLTSFAGVCSWHFCSVVPMTRRPSCFICCAMWSSHQSKLLSLHPQSITSNFSIWSVLSFTVFSSCNDSVHHRWWRYYVLTNFMWCDVSLFSFWISTELATNINHMSG